MKKNLTIIALVLGIFMMGSSYAAQGIYVTGDIGITKQPGFTFRNMAGDQFLKTHYGEGLVAGAGVGYQWDNYRVEGAFDWLNNRAKSATMNGSLSKDNAGKTKASAAMVNVLYDFDNPAPYEWTNYLGLGLGTVHIWHDMDINATNSFHSGATKFAYQGIIGTSYRLSEFVRTNLDYRYLRSAPSTYKVMDGGVIVPMRSKYKNHRVTLSLTAFL